MKKLFADTRILDKACRENFGLSEDLMMENAAESINQLILSISKDFKNPAPKILILVGSGNNGGDGYVLARKLHKNFQIFLYPVSEPKSQMCKIQAERAKKCGIQIIHVDEFEQILKFSDIFPIIYVDCIFGSGFHGKLDQKSAEIIEKINNSTGVKIACDISSGIDSNGNIESQNSNGELLAFSADFTISMGALKTSLYSDISKDFCGKISCAELGVCREIFETCDTNCEPEAILLEKSDLVLPTRKKQNTNKGTFGHTAVILGEKPGAAIIAGSAAFTFGCGLVTLVAASKLAENQNNLPVFCPPELMQNSEIPKNAKSIAVGMGLGFSADSKKIIEKILEFQKKQKIPIVLDADLFSCPEILKFLEQSNSENFPLVLTPHPKEFSSLLKLANFGEFSITEVVKNRISLSKSFVEKFPNSILLVKGANVCVTCKIDGKIKTFINPLGDSCIAKGGSGDVLSGLIAALLAQGFSLFESVKNASLAHAISAQNMSGSYSVSPFDLILGIKNLKIDFE